MNGTGREVFDSVEEAIRDIAQGNAVVVTDDESRENEGDLVMAAAKATPEAVNTMIQHARGLICVPTVTHQLERLGIHRMVAENREPHHTDFTVSVDAAQGISTGISAYDRATTIKILADPTATPNMLVQPGHVFPLRARPGGVLERAGHTEAAVDLASLAGLHPSGVICEILNEDGALARLPELLEYQKRFGLKLISIADLIQYRHQRDCLVKHLMTTPFPYAFRDFELHVFRSVLDNRRHIALTMGTMDERPTLVRVHRENVLSDLFRGNQFDGHTVLQASLERIACEKHGVILYIEQPSSGIPCQMVRNAERSEDTSENMDFRDYGIGAQILSGLGLKKIRLVSSNPRKVIALDGYGLKILEHIDLR